MEKVYIVSKYAGNIEYNVQKAIEYCRFAINEGKMPLASHLLYPQMLDDNIPSERALGCSFGLHMLSFCDEVWVFGEEHSQGMVAEIVEAQTLSKTIKFFTEECHPM